MYSLLSVKFSWMNWFLLPLFDLKPLTLAWYILQSWLTVFPVVLFLPLRIPNNKLRHLVHVFVLEMDIGTYLSVGGLVFTSAFEFTIRLTHSTNLRACAVHVPKMEVRTYKCLSSSYPRTFLLWQNAEGVP